MAAADPADIVRTLKEDHESLEQQLAAVEQVGDDARPDASHELIELLARHEVAEEFVVYQAGTAVSLFDPMRDRAHHG